jgi:hypothetical protein
MPLRSIPGEPNYVHLVWAVRRVTPIQARWIGMFYGEDAIALLAEETEANTEIGSEPHVSSHAYGRS